MIRERLTQCPIAGAYQVCSVISSVAVGSLNSLPEAVVSILNVSNVPALVVTVSWPTTFEEPDRFHVKPLPALTDLN